jgi:hypothetical protein
VCGCSCGELCVVAISRVFGVLKKARASEVPDRSLTKSTDWPFRSGEWAELGTAMVNAEARSTVHSERGGDAIRR